MTDANPLAADPAPTADHGSTRRVGVEVECGGLTEARLAELIAETLGGTPRQSDEYEYLVEGGALGDVKVLLDTALRAKAESRVAKLGLDLSRVVVPVEFVTEPILPEQIAELDRLRTRLRDAGATGSRDGLLLGFGLHFNVAVASQGAEHLVPVLRAFAMLEDWLRLADPIDPSRRLLPWVDPYPRAFADLLAHDEAARWGRDALIRAYLHHAPSRNHALDMLPILRLLDERRVTSALGSAAAAVSARPAWHYRLPDSRIDEADWSLDREWRRWCLVERIAGMPDTMGRLCAAYRDHRSHWAPTRQGWADRTDDILRGAGLLEEIAA